MFSAPNFNLQLAGGAFAFLICVVVYPFYIRWLKHKQVEQFIREEGPQSHAAKARTPTMGGVCFIFGVCITVAFFLILFDAAAWGQRRLCLAVPLVIALACAAIGLADDYGKVTSKSNRGLSARMRLLTELGLGFALGAGLLFFPSVVVQPEIGGIQSFLLSFPSPVSTMLIMGYCLILCPVAVAGAANAVNLHDGMDGLAGGTSAQVFAALSYMLYLEGRGGLAMIAASVSGALLAFLCYNRYRAKVFMGDTGSLFLGGLLATLAFCGGLTFWIIPLGLIYIIEALSVIAQVVYFKLTKPYTGEPLPPLKLFIVKLTKRLPGEGKRLLRMAPIHHHFEAVYADKGVKEWQVVMYFWLAQVVICGLTLLLYKLQ